MTTSEIRFDWTQAQALELLTAPTEMLVDRAREIHRKHADPDVQKCVLLSVKTGACPEDCGYCSQSARFQTSVNAEPLMDVDEVIAHAKKAKASGASRFCMGAAWRDVPQGDRFEKVLQMIEGVAKENMEVCCTLGMATEEQLLKMKTAGLTAYNHNLDTGKKFYPKIISTRTYDERIETLRAARKAGVQICCGAILGMGEELSDRADLLVELSSMNPHPESVPVNMLVPIKGTPMETLDPILFEDFLRTIATARIMMPTSRVRLSAGRNQLSEEEQIRCFDAGANSIFAGETLLTAPNVKWDQDEAMFMKLSPEKKGFVQVSAQPSAIQ